MHGKSSLVIFVVALLGFGLAGVAAAADPTLAAWWKYDETSGTIVSDSSGNGNHGTVMGNPTWVAGTVRGAIHLDGVGDYIEVPPSASLNTIGGTITCTAWVLLEDTSVVHIALAKCYNNTTHTSPYFSYGLHVLANGTPRFWISTANNNQAYAQGAAQLVKGNQWYHMAGVYDGSQLRLYLNGAVVATAAATGNIKEFTTVIRMGTNGGLTEPWKGNLDDIRVYKRAMSVEEVLAVMQGSGPVAEAAADPSPANDAVDVPNDTLLSWTAGEFAATHDVYLGQALADVEAASRTNAMGVLVSQSQGATAYEPAEPLEYGQTYSWRVDEVNAAPDSTIFKGETWNFTIEPFAYPIAGVTATASSSAITMGPQNTVNGSGLTGDVHSKDGTHMWLSSPTGAQPTWIQFELDKVYKLSEMWVWNSNQIIEAFVGFGAKGVAIEYSADGTTWTALADVPEFAQGTGVDGYAHDTTVDFGGVEAKYVKLTINTNWGMLKQYGLSEVRFFYVPVQARLPEPAGGATSVGVDAILNWRPGREATSHAVYLGSDANAMTLVDTVTEHSHTPAALDFGTTYFWKVDEVGAAGTYAGEVWSFTTQEYAVVDDFEGYNDDDNRIFDTWIDGWVNNTGSQVGYDVSPFAEKTIVHGGGQSMPLKYDNSATPFLSEAERTFDTPQNWTTNGADSLVLYFRGVAPGFAQTASGNILMNAIGADIWGTADQFRYAHKTLTGNGAIVARVESVSQSHVWAKAGVMIRQSIEAGSTHAFMPITPGGAGAGNGASFQRRLAANGASTNDNSTTLVAAPYWVKVERMGNAFSGSISPDGVTWTQLGATQTIPMTDPVLIGLALTSHDAAVVTGAEFSNVSTTGNVTGAWQVAEIGAAQPAGNALDSLYISIKDSSGKTKVVQNADPAATVRASWQQWKIPLSEFASAGVKMNAVKTMTIGVGNKAAPTAGGAGIVYIDDLGYGQPLP